MPIKRPYHPEAGKYPTIDLMRQCLRYNGTFDVLLDGL